MKAQSAVITLLLCVGLTDLEAKEVVQKVSVPSTSTLNAFVKAITVTSPSLIKLSASGKISSGHVKNITAKGVSLSVDNCNTTAPCHPLPLHKSSGVDFKEVFDFGALVGYFVPESTQKPSTLFFVGSNGEYVASEAGSLFLGINDNFSADNTGQFSVAIASKAGEKIIDVVASGDEDVTLQIGQRLIVKLDANPSTGFSWSEIESYENYLTFEGADYVQNPDCGFMMTGCSGKSTFTYTAMAKGTGNLKFEYARPWEPQSPIQTVNIKYTIK
jgi:inhibitor of cysteine peptidase